MYLYHVNILRYVIVFEPDFRLKVIFGSANSLQKEQQLGMFIPEVTNLDVYTSLSSEMSGLEKMSQNGHGKVLKDSWAKQYFSDC